MTDEERKRIIAEARATIDRVRYEQEQIWPGDVQRAQEEDVRRLRTAPLVDPVERWRREADARTAEREAAKAEIASASKASWSAIDARIAEHVAQALEHERALLTDIIGEVVAEERNRFSETFKRLEATADQMAEQLERLRALHAAERGQILDLPSPLMRRAN